ncbi:hypothetical protein HMPREF1548_03248 [Clostridium sp. KLE 1755]|nr:hypothetical protein HMPREF1548_03248 [Clostridium sp. KLE 1755]
MLPVPATSDIVSCRIMEVRCKKGTVSFAPSHKNPLWKNIPVQKHFRPAVSAE